jgi:eukaryotic-like serine/threonine-protein kinase
MIGKTIGNYQITSELAQGGMGAVYRGRHVSLPREVVVKAILLASFPPHSQEQLKARFLREAYVQSQLDHPNIVRVYEFFTTTENYYLVMEFIDGMTVRDLLKRQGALAPDRAVPLFKQALSALDYAHNFVYVDEANNRHSGITHRDIKPANLLLDGMGRLKITDFGIVKLAGESSLTRTGFNPGTAEYMSPEQIRGLEVDARSDIYSLGVTFYEILAGRLPFPHAETGSEYEVLRGHIELEPPPLATAQPRVPAALAALVMRALAKAPSDRFSSAAEFLGALLDYERHAAQPAPQLTHSMTEPLGVAAQQTPSPITPPPKAQAPSAPSHVTPAPTTAKTRGYGLLVALALIGLLIVGAGAYLFRRQTDAARVAVTAPATDAPATNVTPDAVPADARLTEARAHEAQERYLEAIKLYDEYLRANAQAADAATLKAHSEELKQLNGLLTTADFELKQQSYADAKSLYEDAIKLRPDSARAKAGLAKVAAQSPRAN